MNFSELIFNKNMLKLLENSKETFENMTEDLTEKKNEIKKKFGNLEETTFWGIIAIIIVILILLLLSILYFYQGD